MRVPHHQPDFYKLAQVPGKRTFGDTEAGGEDGCLDWTGGFDQSFEYLHPPRRADRLE